jgi:hypothetical protein
MLQAAMSADRTGGWCGVGNSDVVPEPEFREELASFDKTAEAVVYHAVHVLDWDDSCGAQPDAQKPQLVLMRPNVAARAAAEFLAERDMAIGASGWAERLCGWLRGRYRLVRRLTRLSHKSHTSDWDAFEPESLWNGGPLKPAERAEACDFGCLFESALLDKYELVPRHLRHVLRKRNEFLYRLAHK